MANAVLFTGLGKELPSLGSSNAFAVLATLQGSLLVALSVVLWLRNAAAGPSVRLARDVAWASLIAVLAGLLYVTLLPDARGEGINGLSRLAAAAVLGYAILRHQLLGLDLKVKWTIRQSTLAGIFIAVFFAVSEGTQALISENAGPFVGIAAAGMLLFAMAPLQRAAERVASAAMPGVRSVSDMSHAEHLQLYREQAAILWSDGTLDREERQALANLRQRLGISTEEAERVDLEVAPR